MLKMLSSLIQIPELSTALVFFAVFLLAMFILTKPGKKLPPGPFAFPIIGNIPTMMRMPVTERPVFSRELAKKYGDIYRIYLGPYMIVLLHEFETIHNTFVKNGHIFSDRPNWLPSIAARRKLGTGLVWENGEKWKQTRRLTLQTMRDFGVGKKSLEDIILDEVSSVDRIFEESKGMPVGNVRHIMTTAISNVIHSIVFGFRYQHDDENFLKLLECFDEIFKGPGPLSIQMFIPEFILSFMIPKAKKQLQSRDHLVKYITEQINEHEKTFDENNIRDFIDLYIQTEKTESNSKFPKESLFRVIIELFAAGTETTGTTLDWALLYMIAHPEIQQRCYEEIDKVVGCGRTVNISDRRNLPYVEATLMEVQRLGNTASGTLPHMAAEDSTIKGYHIPKGTIVLGSISSSHLDPNYWKEPTKFNPDRFLDEDGKIKTSERLIPFSLGPRVCPGESLAKTEMFLMLTNLLQRYRFSKVNESDELNFVGVTGITTSAPPYQLKVACRT